jgi:riboflavin kinase/FMN adenylyltransferase
MNIYRNLNDLPAFKNAVLTIGSFDGVHLGHKSILQRLTQIAQEIDGESIVISFFPHPRNIVFPKNNDLKLLNTIEEKIDLLEQAGVDHLVLIPFSVEFSQLQPREYVEKILIHKFKPAYIVIGYDHKFGLNRSGDIHLLQTYAREGHFKVVEISEFEMEEIVISSTKIRKSLEAGEIEIANGYLGYPYKISGRVIEGNKIGRSLGFPTANIVVSEPLKLIPADGVYAAYITMEDFRYKGMLYIGPRPTVTSTGIRNIEVHIFDFSDNIYGQPICVEVLGFVRGDQQFDSMDELKDQLAEDEKTIRALISEREASKKEKSRVLIAVLNFNGREMLESFLPAMSFSSKTEETDILIIDNNSSDDSVRYVKEWHPEVSVKKLTKNYGFAGGYNKGLKNENAEYIILLNSDVLVTEGWLDPILNMMDQDKTIGVVQPLILSLEHKNMFEYAGAAGGYMDFLAYPFCRGRIFDALEENQNQYTDNAEIFWASGAAMVVRKKVFDNLGAFDDTYFAHQEEIDFCWRARRAGYKVMVCGESKIYHLGGGTLEYTAPRKVYLNFRNNLMTLVKNETWFSIIWKLPVRLMLDGIAGLKFLTAGQWQNTLAIIRAHGQFYFLLGRIFSRKIFEQKCIENHRVGKNRKKGLYNRPVIADYFLFGKKRFSDLAVK